MNRNVCIFCFLALTLAGCSSQPSATASKQAEVKLDKLQGKIQVLVEPGSAQESALNAGGSSIYLWVGSRRYRLFVRQPVEVVHGNQYTVEGVYAQKVIDDIGDPDQGKNGYPLLSSCQRVVRMAWPGLAFDVADLHAETLRARVKRYPARPVFLVSKIEPADAAGADAKKAAPAEKDVPEVEVPADKQRASLVEGPLVQAAPLWDPKGQTVSCKVSIGPDGKIAELETGMQLCEYVDWSKFSYKPTLRGGHPVKVSTEVEIRFEPHK